MFNLMVAGAEDAWNEGQFIWPRSRILEYTMEEIRNKLMGLDLHALEEMAKLPTLFMYEHYTEGEARVGSIKKVQQRGSDVRVIFEFDESVPPIKSGKIKEIQWDLQLEDFEFSRTHWAVKEGDLYEILQASGITVEEIHEELPDPEELNVRAPTVEATPAKVFLVHGRDEAAKHAVARFLERRAGLDVIILSERPSRGRNILTKFQEEAEGATFAVVLMTPDDVGHLKPELASRGEKPPELQGRPRLNVAFELGLFIGKLGVDKVCALVPPGVERPSDYDGIVYVHFDDQEGWQKKLVTELHAANVPVSTTWWQA